MPYEYEGSMGQEMYAPIPRRRRIVEVYGTMPEAQEFIAEEFRLPGLPPAYALRPPLNPKLDPYRHVTVLPTNMALGNDAEPSDRWPAWKLALLFGGVIAFWVGSTVFGGYAGLLDKEG